MPGLVAGVTLNLLLGIGVIYVVTGFGLLEIVGWALRHLRAQLGQISTLVARTLPVLLILVVFLLFAFELWQAAHTLGGDLAAVIGLLLLVAAGLLGGICALYFTGLALTDAAFRAEPRARRR